MVCHLMETTLYCYSLSTKEFLKINLNTFEVQTNKILSEIGSREIIQRIFSWKNRLFLICLNPRRIEDIKVLLFEVCESDENGENITIKKHGIITRFYEVSIINEISEKIQKPVHLKGFDNNRVFIPLNDGSDSFIGAIYDLQKMEKIENFEIY